MEKYGKACMSCTVIALKLLRSKRKYQENKYEVCNVIIIIVGPNVAYHGRFLFPLLVSISVVCLSVLGWAGGVL